MDPSLFGCVQVKHFWLFIWHVSLGWKFHVANEEENSVP